VLAASSLRLCVPLGSRARGHTVSQREHGWRNSVSRGRAATAHGSAAAHPAVVASRRANSARDGYARVTHPTEPEVESSPPSSTGAGREPSPQTRRRLAVWARQHWCFLVVFLTGAALRVLTSVAYRPILLFIDSYRYLSNFRALDPTLSEPIGTTRSCFARSCGRATWRPVAIAQHLVG